MKPDSKEKLQESESRYRPKLSFLETQLAIGVARDSFEKALSERLNLVKVVAPKFLMVGTGLQDDLAGTQKPVNFKTKFSDKDVEVVHSLAKWKRYTLGRYGFKLHSGVVTDMHAIRKDEDVSEIHSVAVDQWDWEIVISREDRTLSFLKDVVSRIYSSLLDAEAMLAERFPSLEPRLPSKIHFVHTEELEEKYPDLSPREREHAIARALGAVFIIGIGHPLKSGEPHDLRAADYDDWSTHSELGKPGLNGDIVVWDAVRQKSLELSSMGIRVDESALEKQLDHMGLSSRRELDFHSKVLSKELPLSIGGGIGQSRLCMLLLHKAHIGEVQASVWPDDMHGEWKDKGVDLL
ncbi:aspartate--ammonia ligase [Candidatus Woesearchaeota archaeon]|nr:aspartate--ammonia ligase [Candidatus Woesearchaeota archaeon]